MPWLYSTQRFVMKDVLKKNLFSIICGVVAILAGLALYWPISGMYIGLQTELTGRIQVGQNVAGIAKMPRNQPQLSPDATTPEPLPGFPTQAVIDAASEAT